MRWPFLGLLSIEQPAFLAASKSRMRPLSFLVAFGGACLTVAGVFSVDAALQRNQVRQPPGELRPGSQPLCWAREMARSWKRVGADSPVATGGWVPPQVQDPFCAPIRGLKLPSPDSLELISGPAAARWAVWTPADPLRPRALGEPLGYMLEEPPPSGLNQEIGRAHV